MAELLTKAQPTFSLWWEQGDNALLAPAAQALPAMIVGPAAGVGAEPCGADEPMRRRPMVTRGRG